MDEERIARVKSLMEREGLDAFICRLPENVLMLSGHWPLIGMTFFLLPVDGTPFCVAPRCDEEEAAGELWEGELISYPYGTLDAGDPLAAIAAVLKEACRGRGYGRVAFEGSFESIAPPWNAAEPAIPAAPTRAMLDDVFGRGSLVDGTDLLHELRARKTPGEQAKLRRANEIAAIGLRAFRAIVEPGVAGAEIASFVQHSIVTEGTLRAGGGRVRAFAQVSTGPEETSRGYRPMVISTSRKLEEGDPALLELGVVVDGFWSDRTRVCVAGTPGPEQQRIFDAVVRAQEAAIGAVRAGVAAGDVDEAARSVLREAGFEKEFLHVTGHGVGLRYHEPSPLIRPGGETVLEPGMVHSVEPGVYDPAIGGFRVEDDVLVTETGAEVLGPADKALGR